MHNTKILILGGGADQIALIKSIRQIIYNCRIILLDYLANPIAKSFADTHIQESTLDKERALAIAKEQNIDYVITACTDQALLTMAYISEQLNLPCYLTYEQALALTNKLYMKQRMVASNIPTSKYICVNKDFQIEQLSTFSYPLVVKPVDSNSSKGVKKIHTPNELREAITDALNFSITRKAIVEEFKSGEELSVDIYIEGSTAKLLSITASKKVKHSNAFTIIQSYYPAPIAYKEDKILEIAQKIAEAFELRDTPLLIQMIVDKEEYNVIEFSARMGGGSKYHLIEVLSGIDIMNVYVNMILGKQPKVAPQKMVNSAIMNYIYCYPGTYTHITGINKLKEESCIEEAFVYKSPYAHFEKASNSSDRVAGFLIVGDNSHEVKEKLIKANDSIKVIDENGKDIMRHDFFYQQ